MATPKDEEIKVRVTARTKARVVALATERGESEAVIVREALNAYLKDDPAPITTPPGERPHLSPYKISRKRKGAP